MSNQQKIEAVRDACDDIETLSRNIDAQVKALRVITDQIRDDGSADAATAAQVLFYVKNSHAVADRAVKDMYAVRDFLDKTIVPAKMEEQGIDMLRIPELARSFSRQSKMSASFLDKQKGFEWLRGIGQGDIIQETVNAGTLASFCRNMILEEGVDPPDDVVKVTTYHTTGINKYTPK